MTNIFGYDHNRLMPRILGTIVSKITYLFLAGSVFAQGLVEPPSGAVNPNVDVRSVPQLVVSLLFGLAIFLAVVYLIYGGIRWITSRGDKVGVESARKHIVAAIIGLVVVLGTFFVINVLFSILGTSNPLREGFTLPTLENPNPGQ